MVMKMNKEKLLDEYIRKEFPLVTGVHPLTEEQRNYVAESRGFQGYLLANAWRQLLNEIKRIFPFNLLFKGSEKE